MMQIKGLSAAQINTRSFIVMCVLVLFAFFTPTLMHTASAAGGGITGMQFGQGFSCSGGTASGQLYTGGDCSGDPSEGQVFSYFVCNFEKIIREALGDVYCSIVEEAKPAVMAALTMAVLFMGMMFLMGMSPFTAKELMIFAAKFSMVLAFATQAEYMIGIGYALFMNVAKEGIVIVLSYLFDGSYSSTDDVYRLFDDALKQMMSLTSADSKKEGGQCQNTLFSMMVLVAAALPPLAFVGAYFMIKLVWVMLRAVFGYCQGILGVTFLVTLAPIYVSFALFKPTRTMFDKWVQYLISFSFQMVVVFAFLGMAFNIMKKMADDITDYTQLVKPYDRDMRTPGSANVLSMCGICEMDKVGPKEKPRCKSNKVMEIGEVAKDENFLHFASVKIMGMVLMFYILDIMMDFVPQMARHLAGQKYAGQLGGGDTGGSSEVDMSMPGEKNVQKALQAGASAFLSSGNSASGLVHGFRAAGGRLVQGAVDEATQTVAGAAGIAGMYGLLRGGAGHSAGFTKSGPQASAKPDEAQGKTVARTAMASARPSDEGQDAAAANRAATGRPADEGQTVNRTAMANTSRSSGADTANKGDDGPDDSSSAAARRVAQARDTSGSSAVSQAIVQALISSRPAAPAKATPVANKDGDKAGEVQEAVYDPDGYDVIGALQMAIAQYGGSVDPATLAAAMQDAALDPSLSSREIAAVRAYLNSFGQVGGGSGMMDA